MFVNFQIYQGDTQMITQDREYEIFLEHVNKMIDRRPGITTTYISINTAIVGVIALVLVSENVNDLGRVFIILTLSFTGVVTCALWRKLVSEYELLLDWWYEQLRVLESKMSNCNNLITKEHTGLYANSKKRISITKYELNLTLLLSFLYGVVSLASLLYLIWL